MGGELRGDVHQERPPVGEAELGGGRGRGAGGSTTVVAASWDEEAV